MQFRGIYPCPDGQGACEVGSGCPPCPPAGFHPSPRPVEGMRGSQQRQTSPEHYGVSKLGRTPQWMQVPEVKWLCAGNTCRQQFLCSRTAKERWPRGRREPEFDQHLAISMKMENKRSKIPSPSSDSVQTVDLPRKARNGANSERDVVLLVTS